MSTAEQDKEYEDAFNELADGESASAEDEFEEQDDEQDDEQQEESQSRDDQGRFAAEPGEEEQEAETVEQQLERYKNESQHWQHRYNSDLGRQNALQRKIQEQQDEIQKLAKQKAPEEMTSKEWAELQEDYPEIAKGIEAKFKADQENHSRELVQLREQLAQVQSRDQEQYKSAQYQILEQHHPDWRDVAQSQNFGEWLGQQPLPVQSLMESEEAADAAYLLNMFKTTTRQAQPDNSEIKQRRERQLKNAQTVPNRGGRTRSNLPAEDDYEASFDYFANQS